MDCYKQGFQNASLAAANAVQGVQTAAKHAPSVAHEESVSIEDTTAEQVERSAAKINNGELSFTFASDLVPFLAQSKLPVSSLGILRQKTEQVR